MTRTRVKFCGITRLADAQAAAACGVDALGFIFDSHSPRVAQAAQAAQIAHDVPPFIATVALFRDANAEVVRATLAVFTPDVVQFHGQETPEFCRGFGLPYLKAVPMAQPQDLGQWARQYADAQALLLDSHSAGTAGGSGRTFDWSKLTHAHAKPLMLAGGLHAGNVALAITMARPYAVDVSSGIESAPGIKDPARMQEFIQQVRQADRDG